MLPMPLNMGAQMPDDLKHFVADDDAEVYGDIVTALGWLLLGIAGAMLIFAAAVIFLGIATVYGV